MTRITELLIDAFQIGIHLFAALLRGGDVTLSFSVLGGQFLHPVLVKLDAVFMTVGFRFQFDPLGLRGVNLPVEVGQQFAQMLKRRFFLNDAAGMVLQFIANLARLFADGNQVGINSIEIVAGKLRLKTLQLVHNFLKTPSLTSLALKRTNLALYFANGVIES